MVAKGYLINAGIVAREYTVGYSLELTPEVIENMYSEAGARPGVLGTIGNGCQRVFNTLWRYCQGELETC
jgi:hypothetical protein